MDHGGPFNIQLSGGEPTMREDLPEIIHMGREKGFTFFQLNTNGIRLAQEAGYARKLKKAGLNTGFLFDFGIYRSLRRQVFSSPGKILCCRSFPDQCLKLSVDITFFHQINAIFTNTFFIVRTSLPIWIGELSWSNVLR